MTRSTVEDSAWIDASFLAWSGLLSRTWTRAESGSEPGPWWLLGEVSGHAWMRDAAWTPIRVDASDARRIGSDGRRVELKLSVRTLKANHFSKKYALHEMAVHAVAKPANLGGVRWWFECPCCLKLRARLFVKTPVAPCACRKCCNLSYASQAESTSARKGKGFGSKARDLRQSDAERRARSRRALRRKYHRARQTVD